MKKLTGNRLFENEQKILKGMSGMILGAIDVGEALCEIKTGNLWRYMDDVETFEQYCVKVHGFKKSTAYNFMGIYEKEGELIRTRPELQSVQLSRGIKLLPHIDAENAEELLLMAATTNAQGFEDNLRERAGKKPTDVCNHDSIQEPFFRCTICGKFIKGEG